MWSELEIVTICSSSSNDAYSSASTCEETESSSSTESKKFEWSSTSNGACQKFRAHEISCFSALLSNCGMCKVLEYFFSNHQQYRASSEFIWKSDESLKSNSLEACQVNFSMLFHIF